jgi:hypothetical protein
MQTAGARTLPEDYPQGIDREAQGANSGGQSGNRDAQGMNREAVLLQWERKIEEAERRPGRFEHSDEEAVLHPSSENDRGDTGSVAPLTEDTTHAAPRRFHRTTNGEVPAGSSRSVAPGPAAGRRTITITGRTAPARRRRSVVENQLAQPDRIALWAFLLGLFLVAVAAGTAHA